MMNKKLLLLNFSRLFVIDLEETLKKESGMDLEIINIDVSLDLNINIYDQIIHLLEPYTKKISDCDFVIVFPPSLNMAAIYIVTQIYAIKNMFPLILEVAKDHKESNSIVSKFRFHRIRNLSTEIMVTRRKLREKNAI